MLNSYLKTLLCCALCFGITACDDEEISTYTAPKEVFITAPTWQQPSHWQQIKLQHTSQLAVFQAGEGTASISILQGNGGGLSANVNRWRRQLGLLPNDAQSIIANSVKVGDWTLVKIMDTKQETGIFGAIITDDKTTTFVKLAADTDTLNKEAESFLQFLTSITWESS